MSRADYERYMFQRSQAQRNRSLTSSGPYQSGYQHDHHDDDDNETDIQTSTSRPNYNPYTQNTLQENQYQSSQPDDSYYDPPGVVRGTPDPNDHHPRLEPSNPIVRFPSRSQIVNNHSSSITPQASQPESYLLQNLAPSDGHVAMPHYAPYQNNNTFSTSFRNNGSVNNDEEYDNYPDPDPDNGRPPTFQVDNRIHNYYNPSASLPQNNSSARSHRFTNSWFGSHHQDPFDDDGPNEAIVQDGSNYDFAPFPVAGGDDYQINPFIQENEENETLLNSTPDDIEPYEHDSLSETTHPSIIQSFRPQQYPQPSTHSEYSDSADETETHNDYPSFPPSQSQSQLHQQQQLTSLPQPYQQSQRSQIFNDSQYGKPSAAPPNIVVQLYHGHLVLDCPVPVKIKKINAQFISTTSESNTKKEFPREFDIMRYSAVTCDPEEFTNQFSLRQQLFNYPRTTEIFICITLYNETEDLLARTLQGIAKNVFFITKKKKKEWGSNAWKKIAVCIIADGREKLNIRTRTLMERLGSFQNGLAKNIVGHKPVKVHLYEHSTLVGINNVKKTVSFGTLKVPMQIIFCIKEHNKGKINSHRWFFQAFSKTLQPKLCVLVDAGTVPSSDSIYHLWNTFDCENNVGGACGEIRASLGRGWNKLSNPLVAAQNFEYKMSNILDKPMESVCGFITVLPGAFSAYRYKALINMEGHKLLTMKHKFTEEGLHRLPFKTQNGLDDQTRETEELGASTQDEAQAAATATAAEAKNNLITQKDPIADDPLMANSPLGQYFKGETMKLQGKSAGIFTANMYLAEDRILCFELVTKKGENWLLKYVKSAHATTDVPERLSELVLQRRRWLNGSFFAAIYSISHVHHLFKSRHNILRKIILLFEFGYQTFSILFSWFGIGNFFLVFRILTKSLGDPALGFSPGNVLSAVFLWLYCACIIAIFVLSFGNRPKGTKFFYTIVVCFFAVLMAYLLFASIYISVKSIIYTLCITGGHLSVSFVFHNPLFRDLVVSLMSTYALYIVSSLLFLEPWHIITSSLQYLLITPSYINVLNVYAFCNLHDISWGTKGDDKVLDDLGGARLKNTKEVETFLPTRQSLIDKAYEKAIARLKMPAPLVEEKPSEEDKTKDWYAMFRSIVVLCWVFSNLALIIVVLNTAGMNAISRDQDGTTKRANMVVKLLTRRELIPAVLESYADTTANVAQYINSLTLAVRQTATTGDNCGTIGASGSVRTEIYLTVILWSVAGLAAFRFVGALIYIVLRLLGPY